MMYNVAKPVSAMKIFFGILLSLLLTGCMTHPQAQRIAALKPPVLIYTYKANGGSCYIRYVGQVAIDQICVEGDVIRYTAAPQAVENYVPMPVQVEALFGSISVERVMERRQSRPAGNASNRTID